MKYHVMAGASCLSGRAATAGTLSGNWLHPKIRPAGTTEVGVSRDLLAAFAENDSVERRRSVRSGRVWHWVFMFTAISGLAGEGVLAWAFVVSLFC